MSSTQQALAIGRPVAVSRSRRPPWHGRLQGSDTTWAIAFIVPYVLVFAAFVIYPVIYGLWMGSDLSLYGMLFSDPRYLTTAINTLMLVAIGVNVMMFLAFLLSGFFMQSELVGALAAGDLPDTLGVALDDRLHVDPFDVGHPMGLA